jgi:hypothetical protein
MMKANARSGRRSKLECKATYERKATIDYGVRRWLAHATRRIGARRVATRSLSVSTPMRMTTSSRFASKSTAWSLARAARARTFSGGRPNSTAADGEIRSERAAVRAQAPIPPAAGRVEAL